MAAAGHRIQGAVDAEMKAEDDPASANRVIERGRHIFINQVGVPGFPRSRFPSLTRSDGAGAQILGRRSTVSGSFVLYLTRSLGFDNAARTRSSGCGTACATSARCSAARADAALGRFRAIVAFTAVRGGHACSPRACSCRRARARLSAFFAPVYVVAVGSGC